MGQAFQRALLLYDPGTGTRVNFASAVFARLLQGQPASGVVAPVLGLGTTSYAQQYCPGVDGWVCRPTQVPPGTDLSFAFETDGGQGGGQGGGGGG